jgi:parvulin-like peptidyl-prolyl isomerase
MIGTIRKHSGWLWAIIIVATIISFLFWGAGPAARNGNGRGSSDNFGSINGKKITPAAYEEARRDVYIRYFLRLHEWPDKNPNVSKDDIMREIYVHLLLVQKAAELGIHVSDDEAVTKATGILDSIGRGQTISMSDFVQRILQPEGLTAADFENFARNEILREEIEETAELAGVLATPQQIEDAYLRNHQNFQAQIVFFPASNYLSQVAVTPAAVAQFYTNYLATYRLPDRVQVSYVEFNVTNLFAQSKTEITNLEDLVAANYRELPANSFPDAKTPEELKSKIREILIRQHALAKARVKANDFAAAVFAVDPPRPENLAAVAKQKGLTVQTTAPFDAQSGPEEFAAPEEFTKAAFGLTPDYPFAGPIPNATVSSAGAVYVIALDRQLPSEIPSFDEIHDRVTQDFQMQQAAAFAREAGTNFNYKLMIGMAAGKSFSSVCAASGLSPQALPPFSLSTPELPALGNRVGLDEVKQVAFNTPVGHASGFEQTDDGGFIIFVQSESPAEQSGIAADLPQFTATLRRARESDAFNEWLGAEANRVLKDTPLNRQEAPSQP